MWYTVGKVIFRSLLVAITLVVVWAVMDHFTGHDKDYYFAFWAAFCGALSAHWVQLSDPL
jgi:hypothetical protein